MDQNNTGWNNSGSGSGSTGSGSTGTTGSGTGTGGGFGAGSGSGSMGGGSGSMGSGAMGSGAMGGTSSGSAFGTTTGTDGALCPTCGQSTKGGSGLEQFLGRLGITDDMVNSLKSQFQNVEIDEYLNTARDYLTNGSNKATTYAKDNPGKVAAGVAALALGAGLIYASTRDKD